MQSIIMILGGMFLGQELATLSKSKSRQMWRLLDRKNSVFGNFKALPLLANSITRCFMNAQHSIFDSLMMLPKLATSIIHSQHIQIWQTFRSVLYYSLLHFIVGFGFYFWKIVNFCQIWQA